MTPNYMTLWKRQNYRDSKKISNFQKCVGGDRFEGKTGGVQNFTALKILYMVC